MKIHDMSDTCCDTHLVFAFYVASFWVILLLNHPQQQQNLLILCHFLSETRRGSAEQSPPDPGIVCMNVAVSCVSYVENNPLKLRLARVFYIIVSSFLGPFCCVFFSWSLILGANLSKKPSGPGRSGPLRTEKLPPSNVKKY